MRTKLLILPFAFYFLFFILGPLVQVLIISFSERGIYGTVENNFSIEAYKLLLDPLYFNVLKDSIVIALLNTVFCVLLAYPLAFYISRQNPVMRLFLLSFILIPFWTSFIVRVFSFMDVLRLPIWGVDLLYTKAGIVLGLVYNYLPMAVLPIYARMEKIEASALEAAHDLGASSKQVFFKVLLPLTKSAIITASIFVFVPSLGDFLIPQLLGGGKHFFLGNFLQNQFLTARNWPLGSAMLVLVLVTALVSLLFVFKQNSKTEALQTKLK